MKFLGCLVLVAVIGAVTAVYSPKLLEIIEGESSEPSGDVAAPRTSPERDYEREERARKQRRSAREFNDAAAEIRDTQIERMEAQIDQLEQGERDCQSAARQRGSTDRNCQIYADRIRAAEDRLREYRQR